MKKIFVNNDLFFLSKKNAGKGATLYMCKIEFWADAFVSNLLQDSEKYQPTEEEERILLDAKIITPADFIFLLNNPSEEDKISEPVNGENIIPIEIITSDIEQKERENKLIETINEFQKRLELLENENKTLKTKKILSYEESLELLNKKNNITKLIKTYDSTAKKIENLQVLINQKSELLSLEDEKVFLKVEKDGYGGGVIFSTSNIFMLTDFVNYTGTRIAEEIEKNKKLLLSL